MLIDKEALEAVGVKLEKDINETVVFDQVSAALKKATVRMRVLALMQEPWNRTKYNELAKRIEDLADEVQNDIDRREYEEQQRVEKQIAEEEAKKNQDIPF